MNQGDPKKIRSHQRKYPRPEFDLSNCSSGSSLFSSCPCSADSVIVRSSRSLKVSPWYMSSIALHSHRRTLAFHRLMIGYMLSYFSFILFVLSHKNMRHRDPDALLPETRLYWPVYLTPLEVIGLFDSPVRLSLILNSYFIVRSLQTNQGITIAP
jgi:hypothetical protein